VASRTDSKGGFVRHLGGFEFALSLRRPSSANAFALVGHLRDFSQLGCESPREVFDPGNCVGCEVAP
jgi:hypothetical protein